MLNKDHKTEDIIFDRTCPRLLAFFILPHLPAKPASLLPTAIFEIKRSL